jgi:hypothetical protein
MGKKGQATKCLFLPKTSGLGIGWRFSLYLQLYSPYPHLQLQKKQKLFFIFFQRPRKRSYIARADEYKPIRGIKANRRGRLEDESGRTDEMNVRTVIFA